MKTINILLSSYNGERYIAEQLESILTQEKVDVRLTIRDDGSKDKTIQIIDDYIAKYPQKIKLIKGENIGYRKSFLKLLQEAEDADYYAFSDQDDLWLPQKCIRGINKIEYENKNVALYATGVVLVDDKLKIMGNTDSWKMPLTLESYFTRQRLAGCTYIFNNGLRNIARRFADLDLPNKQMPDHDFVVGSCAFACGNVYLDRKASIYHRRHNRSVTSGGNGVVKRIIVEFGLVFKRPKVQSTMANLLLEKCKNDISEEKQKFLYKITMYDSDMVSRIKLAFFSKMKTGIFICDLETKIKILIGQY